MTSPLGPGDLVLCAGSVAGASFVEKVNAAGAAGFRGLSLFVDDYLGARASGLSDAEMRRMLEDRDLAIAELDPLLAWLPGMDLAADASDEGAGFFRHRQDDFHRVADALGARSLNLAAYCEEAVPREALAEAFAGVCDRAAEHGLLVHLEFLPWTQVANVDDALAVAELAARPNGGVMLDAWHHFRGGVPDAHLRELPGERILGVQLSDAPTAPGPDPVEETLRRRLLPGAGAIDLRGICGALRAIGSPAPLGVEVFSDVLAALPPDEAARRAAEAVRAVLGRKA